MEKYIMSASYTDVSIESLLFALHMDKENDLFENIMKLYKEAIEIAKPIALYMLVYPDLSDGELKLNGIRFKEPFVYKMLSGSSLVVPYVASCGGEIDRWSQTFTDIYEKFVADVLKQLFLKEIREKLFIKVKEKYFNADKNISTINPGSLDKWPITGQISLFDLLGGVTDDIGVVLSSSLLMSPTKSVSGIIFPSNNVYHNCQLCPRTDCPNRYIP